MEIKLSKKAKKELKEIEDKIRGDMTDEEWNFFKKIRGVCEFYMYQVLKMEHLDRKGKRDWIKRLVESKVKEEREKRSNTNISKITKLIDDEIANIHQLCSVRLEKELTPILKDLREKIIKIGREKIK